MINVLDELIAHQRKKLMQMAEKFVPNITYEDLLQPNDYPELEQSAHFRHEEGILDGLQMAKAALLAYLANNHSPVLCKKKESKKST